LFSFIKNLRPNKHAKISTESGGRFHQTDQRGAAERNQSEGRGGRRRAVPDELHRGGGREEEAEADGIEGELELLAFSEREGRNPSLKADLAEDGGVTGESV
jgi:hypothetical protein